MGKIEIPKVTRADAVKGLAGILAAGAFPAIGATGLMRGLAARTALSAGGVKLPYDEELQWIRSSGHQYINTIHRYTSNVDFQASVDCVSQAAKYLYGQTRNAAKQATCICFASSQYWRFDGTYTQGNGVPTGSFGFIRQNRSFSENLGVKKYYVGTVSVFDAYGNYPVYIFAVHDYTGGGANFSSAKLQWFQIREGETLVRDFIPVLKDGEACLYDRAKPEESANGDGFYRNLGSGTFGYLKRDGTEVEPT